MSSITTTVIASDLTVISSVNHAINSSATSRLAGNKAAGMFKKMAYKRCCDRLLNVARSAILTVKKNHYLIQLTSKPRTIRINHRSSKGPSQSKPARKQDPDPDPARPLSLGIGLHTNYPSAPPLFLNSFIGF